MLSKQSRPRHSRSTRGCRTCRIRHLKCDEKFPCRRCVNAGWQCDKPDPSNTIIFHHEQPPKITTPPMPTPVELSPFRWLSSPHERRAFEFYLHRAAPLLSGALDWEYWSWLVPSLAETDLVVRYAMLAVSHLCEYPMRVNEDGHLRVHPLDNQHVLGLQWHAKTLSVAKKGAPHARKSDLILQYALLSSHEFQQNTFRSGRKLARMAFSLLPPMLTHELENCYNSTASDDTILRVLVPLFTRNTCLLFDSSDHFEDSTLETTTLEDFQVSVLNKLCTALAYVKDFYFTCQSGSHARHNGILARKMEIQSTLLMLRDRIYASHDQSQQKRQKALQEYCDIALCWLDCVARFSVATFSERSYLLMVLKQTRHFQDNAPVLYPSASSTAFFHTFIICPTAFLVAIFTKDTAVRLEALSMMKERTFETSGSLLLTVVITTQDSLNKQTERRRGEGVFKIYHGHKNGQIQVDDVHDDSSVPF